MSVANVSGSFNVFLHIIHRFSGWAETIFFLIVMNDISESKNLAEIHASKNSTNERLRLDYLDGLRALAALYVVAVHALTQVDRNHTILVGKWQWFTSMFSYGHYAVDVFIVLSGFCLMLPIVRDDWTLRGGTLNFFKKRARRILPPYYFCLFICVVLILLLLHEKVGSQWDEFIPITLFGLVSHLLLFQDAFSSTSGQINGVLWSISVEWRIYFAFPLIVWCWRKYGPWLTTFSCIVVGFVLLCALRLTPIFTYTNGVSTHYLGLFALGNLSCGIAYSSDTKLLAWRQKAVWGWFYILMALVIWFLSSLPVLIGKTMPVSIIDLAVGVFAMSLLIFLAKNEKTVLYRFLSKKPLVFLGGFAYSIYLMHLPFLELIWRYVVRLSNLSFPFKFFILYVTIVPVVVIICYGFFLICERPFLNQNQKKRQIVTSDTS